MLAFIPKINNEQWSTDAICQFGTVPPENAFDFCFLAVVSLFGEKILQATPRKKA